MSDTMDRVRGSRATGIAAESLPVLKGEFLDGKALFDERDGTVEAIIQNIFMLCVRICHLVLRLLPVPIHALHIVTLLPDTPQPFIRTALPQSLPGLPSGHAGEHHGTEPNLAIAGILTRLLHGLLVFAV
jgi:hypothetical protein